MTPKLGPGPIGLGALWLLCLAAAPAAAATPVQAYDDLLRRHVKQGFVDYRGLGRADARQALAGYLQAVAAADVAAEGPPQARLAGWLNAYNALVLQGILDGGSPATLWGRFSFFKQARHRVYGRELTLDALENEVIRKDFAEPRVHFALVCASKSCPPLRAEAYSGARLDRQLDEQAQAFLADGSKNRFDAATRTLWLSAIFKWYGADFERAAGTVPAYVARHAPAAARGWIAGPDVRVAYLDYDWGLNGRK